MCCDQEQSLWCHMPRFKTWLYHLLTWWQVTQLPLGLFSLWKMCKMSKPSSSRLISRLKEVVFSTERAWPICACHNIPLLLFSSFWALPPGAGLGSPGLSMEHLGRLPFPVSLALVLQWEIFKSLRREMSKMLQVYTVSENNYLHVPMSRFIKSPSWTYSYGEPRGGHKSNQNGGSWNKVLNPGPNPGFINCQRGEWLGNEWLWDWWGVCEHHVLG